MNFNKPLYGYLHHVKHERGDIERYSFIFDRKLGKNGLWENHKLKGKTAIDNETNEKYVIDDVYLHWYYGWYFVASIRNSENSHSQFTWSVTENEYGESTFQKYTVDCEYNFLADFKSFKGY